MKLTTARRVVEIASVIFLETLILVVFYPELRNPPAALVATVSLVTALVVLFDNFYKTPS